MDLVALQLNISHMLLQSVMSDEKLVSQIKPARPQPDKVILAGNGRSGGEHPIRIIEANTTEEEIIAAGLDIKERGIDPNDCAILVPKNSQVRRALEILHNMGLEVASLEMLNLFDQEETGMFLRVLKIINNGDLPYFALSFFDKVSGVEPLQAHKFFAEENMRKPARPNGRSDGFSFSMLKKTNPSLFGNNNVEKWIEKLLKWKKFAENNKNDKLELLVKTIGEELFVSQINRKLVTGEEILNTILGLLTKELEKNPNLNLSQFISYLEKLELYGEPISLLTSPKNGVKVLTMHSSKGLEFDYVWIAHMDERSLSGGRKMNFTLPENIASKIEERDIDAIKRKLYVAITRAKRFCTLSYAVESLTGNNQELSSVIAQLPKEVFKKEKAKIKNKGEKEAKDLSELKKLVSKKYSNRYVSVSLLNNFFECPWKWYFRNLLGLPEPVSPSLEFGSKVHTAIDKILKLSRA